MAVKAILARDDEYGIGKDGKLPWHYPEDLQYFRFITLKDVVVMGRKSWDSLPPFAKPLPDRKNIVLSRSLIKLPDGVICMDLEDLEEYIDLAADIDVWIIGGAEIINQLAHLIEEFHITRIPGTHECDTFFDPKVLDGMKLSGHLQLQRDLRDTIKVEIWRRSSSND